LLPCGVPAWGPELAPALGPFLTRPPASRAYRLGVQIHPISKADATVRIDNCGTTSVRIGVMQTISQSARTGENWFSKENVGRVIYCGAGIFSGNSREKSRLSGAINSGLVAGDTIGVHVCGDDVTFSKNGAPIPGTLRRVGPVYFGVQLCMPGDKVTLVRLSHAADG
jgi:hypothetical protein